MNPRFISAVITLIFVFALSSVAIADKPDKGGKGKKTGKVIRKAEEREEKNIRKEEKKDDKFVNSHDARDGRLDKDKDKDKRKPK
jgi:hypothetical protein